MKKLYLDLNNGVAGDMLSSALLSLFDNKQEIVDELNSFNIPCVKYVYEKRNSHGLEGGHMSVEINGELEEHFYHHHHSRHLSDVKHIVSHFDIEESIKKDIYAVYDLIAEAESRVHGTTVEEIHFHEVGDLDAIADITCVCLLMNKLNPDEVISSKICVGSGTVKCAHGVLSVPAPACLELLKDMPFYQSDKVNSELATPTGIALVKYFTNKYEDMNNLNIKKVGIGIGDRDFGIFTGLRVLLFEDEEKDTYKLVMFNVDDMSGEEVAYALEKIKDAGAIEVYTSSIYMKKNRPGIEFKIVCTQKNLNEVLETTFKYTSTIGTKVIDFDLIKLNREVVIENTTLGPIRKKISSGFNVTKEKYEFEDLKKIAEEKNLTINEVLKILNTK